MGHISAFKNINENLVQYNDTGGKELWKTRIK